MRIEPVRIKTNLTFQHTSSDYYIKTGRYLGIDKVCKNLFRDFDPWYKKLLYPIEDLVDFVSKRIKRGK